MDQDLILLPEELFYLGKLLNAERIDYAYIAAMKDIQQNYEAANQDIECSLCEKNYITIDFSGTVDVDTRVQALISPLYFGLFESTINICVIDEKATVTTIRIHSDDKLCVCVVLKEDGFHIFELADDQLLGIIAGLLPEDYLSVSLPERKEVIKEKITRVIAFKNITVGKSSEVKVYFENDGFMCRSIGEDVEMVDGVTFCSDAYRVLKGENYGIS